jgi:hypothetical protein
MENSVKELVEHLMDYISCTPDWFGEDEELYFIEGVGLTSYANDSRKQAGIVCVYPGTEKGAEELRRLLGNLFKVAIQGTKGIAIYTGRDNSDICLEKFEIYEGEDEDMDMDERVGGYEYWGVIQGCEVYIGYD